MPRHAETGPSRRSFIAAGGFTASAAVAVGTAGVTNLLGAPRAVGVDLTAALRQLDAQIAGDVLLPGTTAYTSAKQLFNPRWDPARPVAVVRPTNASDTSRALGFARAHGLRVAARSGGHSYVGASTGTGSLVIDTRRLRAVTYSPTTGLATVGAGANLYAVKATLAAYGRTIPTGTCPTVGAAGLTLGGGIGTASREHGLTCDAVVSIRVVTGDGTVRAIDARGYPEQFWALRGGGGGHVGIVNAFTFRTHATRRQGLFILTFPAWSAARVLQGWAARMEAAPRSTWESVHINALGTGGISVQVVGVTVAGRETAEAALLARAIGVTPTSTYAIERDYLAAVQWLGGGTTSARAGFFAGSDVVHTMDVGTANAIVAAVRARSSAGHTGSALVDPLSGAVRDLAPSATAFPWRRHVATIQWYAGLPTTAGSTQYASAQAWVTDAHLKLRSHSSGAYVNYIEPGRNYATYLGSNANAARLLAASRRFDPSRLFG